MSSTIIEYAIEFKNKTQQLRLEQAMRALEIAFYEEPPRATPWKTLEEIEIELEGK